MCVYKDMRKIQQISVYKKPCKLNKEIFCVYKDIKKEGFLFVEFFARKNLKLRNCSFHKVSVPRNYLLTVKKQNCVNKFLFELKEVFPGKTSQQK